MEGALFEDNEKTLEIFEYSLGVGVCNYAPCSAKITWGQIVKTGKLMCFNGSLSAQRIIRTGMHEGKRTVFLPFEDNHWATCVGRDLFRRTT